MCSELLYELGTKHKIAFAAGCPLIVFGSYAAGAAAVAKFHTV